MAVALIVVLFSAIVLPTICICICICIGLGIAIGSRVGVGVGVVVTVVVGCSAGGHIFMHNICEGVDASTTEWTPWLRFSPFAELPSARTTDVVVSTRQQDSVARL